MLFVATIRQLLNLKPTEQFMKLAFHEVSALVYRDNIWQKHDSRDRFRKELVTNKAIEESQKSQQAKALKEQQPPVDPMMEMFIEHLLGVSWSMLS